MSLGEVPITLTRFLGVPVPESCQVGAPLFSVPWAKCFTSSLNPHKQLHEVHGRRAEATCHIAGRWQNWGVDPGQVK